MKEADQAKVYILCENQEWLAPIENGLQKHGIPTQAWDISSGKVPINEVPPQGIFFNKMSASSFTRGNLHAKDLCAPLLAWLQAHGRRVINKRNVLQFEISKAEQQIALQQFGLNTPKTIVAVGKEEVVEATIALNQTPFIIKPNQGGKGLGVQLFQSIIELEEFLNLNPMENLTVDGVLLVQEYIPPRGQFITRMEFIGGKFYYAVRVDTGGGFELCPADACEVDLNNPDKVLPGFSILKDFNIPEIEKCEAFLAANDIEIAGMEFMENEAGERFFYDVNTNTNYNSEAEKKSGMGVNGIEAVCQFLKTEFQKL